MTNRYMFFSNNELKCKCGVCAFGQNDMNGVFMGRLVDMRMEAGFPFPLNSAIRCKRHDKQAGGAGIHPSGHCVDVRIYSQEQANWIINNCHSFGMTGRGMKIHGPWKYRFIHLDDLCNVPGHIRPASWTYV